MVVPASRSTMHYVGQTEPVRVRGRHGRLAWKCDSWIQLKGKNWPENVVQNFYTKYPDMDDGGTREKRILDNGPQESDLNKIRCFYGCKQADECNMLHTDVDE